MQFKSLNLNIYIRILISFLVIFVIYSIITYQETKAIVENETFTKIEHQLESKVEEINGYFVEKHEILKVLKTSPTLQNFMADAPRDFNPNNYKKYQTAIKFFKDIKNTNPDLKTIAIASDVSDRYYNLQGYISEDSYYLNERPSYVESKKNKEFEFEDPWEDNVDLKLHVSMREPVINDANKYLGFVAIDLTLEIVFDALNKLKVSDDSQVFATNNNGKVLIHENEELINNISIENFDQLGYEFSESQVDEFVSNSKGRLIIKDNGIDKFVFFLELPINGWKIVTMVPVNTIMAPVIELESTIYYSIGLGALLVSLVLIWVSTGIANPVKNLVVRFKDLSQGEGDLSVRLKINRKDELGQVGSWFNLFMQKLSGILRDVVDNVFNVSKNIESLDSQGKDALEKSNLQNKSVNEINRSINNMTTNIDQISQFSSSTNTAIQQIAKTIEDFNHSLDIEANNLSEVNEQIMIVSSTLEEIMATSASISNQMEGVAEESQGNTRLAQDGMQKANQLSDEMDSISLTINENAESINELNAKVEKIDEILAVINEVADQTNLLALNAAIEAARAGEAGRGFSIVADEIRKLAEKTTKAIDEISNMTKGIQSSSIKVVEAVNDEVKKASSSKEIAQQSGEAFKKIFTSIQKLNNIIQEGSRSSAEQASGIEELMKSFKMIEDLSNEINNQAQQQTAGSTQMVASIEHVAEITQRTENEMEKVSNETTEIALNANNLLELSQDNKEFIESLFKNILESERGMEELIEKLKQFKFDEK